MIKEIIPHLGLKPGMFVCIADETRIENLMHIPKFVTVDVCSEKYAVVKALNNYGCCIPHHNFLQMDNPGMYDVSVCELPVRKSYNYLLQMVKVTRKGGLIAVKFPDGDQHENKPYYHYLSLHKATFVEINRRHYALLEKKTDGV